MITFKEYLSEGNLAAKDLEAKIGKTRLRALVKHPYHQKFVQGSYLQPTEYQHTENDIKHIVKASNDGKHMVQFELYKVNHRVSNAHLYKWEGDYIHGQKRWHKISSHIKEE